LGLYDWDTSAGGSYTDEELTARSNDKNLSRKQRGAAKKALAFRAKFRESLDTASYAADVSGNETARGAVASYGSENDHNGVLVGVAAQDVSGSAARTMLNLDDTISVNFNPSAKGDRLAVTIAHEGVHVADAQTWVMAGEPNGGVLGALNLNHFFREERAWYVSSYIAEALGMKQYGVLGGGREYEVWSSGWKAADRDTLRTRGVNKILGQLYSASPTDTNTYFSEHPPHFTN